MSGGSRLFWTPLSLFVFVLITAAVWAGNDAPTATPPGAAPPKAPVHLVEETVQGHRITDSYRWLEDAKSPETQRYVEQEMSYTRGILDPLPGREQIQQRLTQLASIGNIGTPQAAGKYYFYNRRDGTENQAVLYVREDIRGKDRALVDVNKISADGTVALDWWFPSEDGKYLAYGLSSNGSEDSTLHIINTATGDLLPDVIERTRFASLTWKKDDSGFYYNRQPKAGEVPAGQEVYFSKIYYHALGSDSATDPLIFGEGRNPQDIPGVQLADDDDRWLVFTVFEGWAKSEMYLQDLKAGTPPVEVTSGKDFLYNGEVFQGRLYITTNDGAPRFRLFVVDATNPKRENWKEIVPQTDAVLQGASIAGGKIVTQYQKNASSLLKVFELDGKVIGEVSLPSIGTVAGLGSRWDRNEAFFQFQSFTVPPSIYQVDLSTRRTQLWGSVSAPVDASAYEVKQVWYASKDGTKIPMFVFYKKGLQLDGKNPALLTGYGGFNLSQTPSFVGSRYVWLEHGGIFAVANLRGGSEFGEDWHRAGMLEKKQNVFDDFIAASEYLISQKYTDKDHLAIQGGSNGGLLVGAAFTQRPDLFRAVVCQVPLLDMLRYQNFQIAKLWIPEYGSAEDPKQFEWLYAYSPYHRVKQGTQYPSILFMTADTDTRVDPMHAKKMAALMQAEAANGQSKERPILLRIETRAGHGPGKPVAKQIEEGVDIYSYLFWQLGVKP
jgi:prolyl oligopeptidase